MKSHLWQLKLFQNFLGDHAPPDPLWLACAFRACFNLRRLLCFIGNLWKLLLRTLIRHQDHKDQETAPWWLHCTLIYEYRYHCETETVLSSMTVKSIKYIHRKEHMCAKKWRRGESRSLISRLTRGITSIKKNNISRGIS